MERFACSMSLPATRYGASNDARLRRPVRHAAGGTTRSMDTKGVAVSPAPRASFAKPQGVSHGLATRGQSEGPLVNDRAELVARVTTAASNGSGPAVGAHQCT
jgi:hypothetical protein